MSDHAGQPHSLPPTSGAPQTELVVVLPPEAMEALAQRVAAIVLERSGEAVPPASPQSEYLSVAEAAELLRAKPQRVYDLLSAGRLTRLKDGSRVLVSRAEIEAYLRGERVAPVLPLRSRARMTRGRAA